MHDRRFIVSVALWLGGLVAAWTLVVLAQVGAPTKLSAHVAGMIAFKERAAAAVAGPKTIVLGGSSVFAGIHCAELGVLTGQPAVNFGLTLALGPDYILRLGRQTARPGDTVILVLEYEQYADTSLRSPLLTDYVLGEDPAYFRSLPWRTEAEWVLGLPFKRVGKAFLGMASGEPHEQLVDPDQSMDAAGDRMENHLSQRTPGMLRELVSYRIPDHYRVWQEAERDGTVLPRIRAFHRWCGEHGVRLLVAFPPYPDDAPPGAELDPFFASLIRFYDAEGIPRLGTPWESLYPRDAFFDSCYHLTYEAASVRTGVVAKELLALKNSGAPVPGK